MKSASACRPEQSQKWAPATSTTTCRVPWPARPGEGVGEKGAGREVGVAGQADHDLVGGGDEGDVELGHGASGDLCDGDRPGFDGRFRA